MPITLSRQQLSDLYRQSRGFGENALSMLTGGIGEPVAGIASLAALARGENAAGARDAVRDAFTYQPRTAEGQGQQRMLGELAQSALNSAPVRTWQRGVDYAGRASPVAGATLQTVPTALGALTGYKPAMQTGQAASRALAQAQRAAMENAMMPRVLHPQRGVFAGINAKTSDLKALDSARKMLTDGVPANEVLAKTGWTIGADGRWRFEIDDSKAYFAVNNDFGETIHELKPGGKEEYGARSLDRALKHDPLFAAYPALRDVRVRFSKELKDSSAHYDPAKNEIALSPDLDGSIGKNSLKSVLLHEIQHAVQGSEGFASGGSIQAMGRKVAEARAEVDSLSQRLQRIENEAGAEADLWVAKYPDKVKDALDYLRKQDMFDEGDNVRDAVKYAIHDRDPSYQSLTKQWKQAKWAAQQSPTESYSRLAGEVEARNVQARMNMGQEDRMRTPPIKTEDRARNLQIRIND